MRKVYYVEFSGDPEKEDDINIINLKRVAKGLPIGKSALTVYGYCLVEEMKEKNTKFYIDVLYDYGKLSDDSEIKIIFSFMIGLLNTEFRNYKIKKILN